MNRARAVLTALSLLATLGLAGCSDDDPEPKFEPTPTSAPSSAATTEAAALETPEDVVRAWVDAQNEALKTGDTTEIRSLSAENCRGCSPFIESIEDVFNKGGHYETAGWTVVAAKVTKKGSKSITVDTGIAMAGGKTIPAMDAEPIRFPKDNVIMTFEVVGFPDHGQVSLVAFVE